ncbi:sulfatase family protein [Ferrimonas pelagia]|uniref:Sulfatase N-terminal domain-containing protein n=1 Tax=Ferrimonas pelagia TaxID=1177826 RepID=A0ABP9EZU2_9GAMM
MIKANFPILLSAAALSASLTVQANTAPNVIIILTDDQGWGDVGYHGIEDIHTPNIDRLAAGGTAFAQAYVTASVSGPSRAGLITGLHQQKLGFYGNGELSVIPHSQPTLAEMLQTQGYDTGMIGKWHLGQEEDQMPWRRGFDFYYGSPHGSHDYFRSSNSLEETRKRFLPMLRNGKVDTPVQERGDYLTDVYTDEAIQFIESEREAPFFLYLAHNAVHFPWQVAERYIDRLADLPVHHEERRFFAGMVLAVDDSVGRIMQSLEENDLSEDTLVLFLSDNGAPRGQGFEAPKQKDRGQTTMASPGPFNGFKGDTYEGGLRVPFVAHWPGTIPAGQIYPHPVVSYDIAPTILARSGVIQPMKGLPFDGVDLLPYLSGQIEPQQRPHQTLHWRRDNDYAIRDGDWKLTWNSQSGPQTIRLFDLKSDPEERNDVVDRYPERAQMMQDRFDDWDSRLPSNMAGKDPQNRNDHYQQGQRTNVMQFNDQERAN